VLCFEIWKNEEKLVTAGLSDTGVLSFVLSWVGKEPGASAIAAAMPGTVPGLHCAVGGLDTALNPGGDRQVVWYETEAMRIGDEFRVRLVSSNNPDPPTQSTVVPRGNPEWAANRGGNAE
jgi:hypothetical protein